MGIFGLSFGKSSSKSKTDIDKTETTDQQQSTTSNQTQNTQTNTSQTGSSQGTSATTQAGSSQTNTAKTSDLTGRTSLFGDQILGTLEGTVASLLGTTKPATLTADTFDSRKFVDDTVKQAESKSRDFLDTAQGALGDSIGANPLNSSMGTLLLNRANSDAAASVAGTRAQAESTAAGIDNARNQLELASGQQSTDFLTQLLSILKGGTQATTSSGTEGTTGTEATTQTGTTNTSESSKQDTAATSAQTIQSLVQALLQGTTHTVGTESTKGSGTQIGASLNLGGSK